MSLTLSQQLGLLNTTILADALPISFIAQSNLIYVTGAAAGGSGQFGTTSVTTLAGGNSVFRINMYKGRLIGVGNDPSDPTVGQCVTICMDDGAGQRSVSNGGAAQDCAPMINGRGFIATHSGGTTQIRISQDGGVTFSTPALSTLTTVTQICCDDAINFATFTLNGSQTIETFYAPSATLGHVTFTGSVAVQKYVAGPFSTGRGIMGFATTKGLGFCLPVVGAGVPTEILLDGTNGFLDLAYSPTLTLWVGVGNNGHIWTAPANADGSMPVAASWTQRTSPTTSALKCVEWVPTQPKLASGVAAFGAKFVALGAAGAACYSTDGITWNAITGIGTGNFNQHSLAFGVLPSDGKMHVVICNDAASSLAWNSIDGITFAGGNAVGASLAGPTSSQGGVVFGVKNFVFQASASAVQAISTDGGVTWTVMSAFPGWFQTPSTLGADSLVIGSRSGELLRLKGGKGATNPSTPGDGGSSNPWRVSRGASTAPGAGEGGQGGYPATPPCPSSGAGGPANTTVYGGGAAIQAVNLLNGSPRKLPGASGGYNINAGGGAASFGFGGGPFQNGQGPGGGASGNGSLAGSGAGESAVRMAIIVQPGELITMIPGLACWDPSRVDPGTSVVGNDGMLLVEYAA